MPSISGFENARRRTRPDLVGALLVGATPVLFDGNPAYPSLDTLWQLAEQARHLHGYMVQVEGYASAVGSDDANQRLSMRRADAVAAVLNQNGIPPAKMVVPAAMGESQQLVPSASIKGQTENRRTVVTLLQNKGIVEK